MPGPKSFRPQSVERLEERRVLHHGSKSISVVTSALQGPTQGFIQNQSPTITTLVNATFDTFLRDYSASRSVYFDSIRSRTAPGTIPSSTSTDPSGDLAALRQYTQQRVNLLAQQLLNNFFQSSPYAKHAHGQTDPLSIITRKINGPASATSVKAPFLNGTLGAALIAAIPSENASPTAISLNSLAQDNAIETARESILNGLNSIKVQKSRHH